MRATQAEAGLTGRHSYSGDPVRAQKNCKSVYNGTDTRFHNV